MKSRLIYKIESFETTLTTLNHKPLLKSSPSYVFARVLATAMYSALQNDFSGNFRISYSSNASGHFFYRIPLGDYLYVQLERKVERLIFHRFSPNLNLHVKLVIPSKFKLS